MKLIVLDRLIALKEHPTQERVLQDLVMDILRVLASPDLEVRKKTLNLGEFKLPTLDAAETFVFQNLY